MIARGPVPVRLAIGYAIDISEALRVAHGASIVHRDLKPANVVVTESGFAKVLDFGIAKLVVDEATATDRGTMTAVTQDHAVLGTIGYMSPEQAEGQPLDGRSDIFCLGVVLHEMISGRRAFEGDSTAALLSAVLRDEPTRLRTLAPSTPRSVERCVTRCLEKDRRRRYQHAADVKAALEDIREDLELPALTADGRDVSTSKTSATIRTRVLRALAYAAAALTAAFALFSADVFPPPVEVPTFRPFISETGSVGLPVWAPDGRTLAYVALIDRQLQLFVRGFDAAQSTRVTTQATDGISVFWSPDGARIFFTRAGDGNLMSVSAGGGEPQVMLKAAAEEQAGRVGRPAGGLKACISPDAQTVVVSRGSRGDAEGVRLWALNTHTGDARPLDPAGMPPRLANIQALAFSPDGSSLAAIASTTALNDARGVWLISWPGRSARLLFADAAYLASNPSISWLPDSRRFVMNGYPLHGGANRLLMADTRSGTLRPLTGGKDEEESPSVAPDGSSIAFVSRQSGLDLIQYPIDGGPPEPLLATSRAESSPDMTQSGVLAYVTDASGSPEVRIRTGTDAWPRPIGGGGGSEQDRATQPVEVRLSPDGQRVAIGTYAAEHLIWIYPTAGGSRVRLDAETTDQHGPSWSPDGNWIAYRRLKNGSWELVKTPLGGGQIVRLDDAAPGGTATDWSPTGRWIAHWRPDGMHLVSPEDASARVLAGFGAGAFRFSHDGSRLFGIRRGAGARWELIIWSLESFRELRSVALPIAASAEIRGMALTPDESRVIVGTGTGTSDIWLLEHFQPAEPRWMRWLGR